MTKKKDNAQKWYDYALATGDDSVARFMMYWIAFNFKYGEYRRRRTDHKQNSDKANQKNSIWNTEREQIEILCNEKYEDLIDYDPFVQDRDATEKLIELPVFNGRAVPAQCKPKLPPGNLKPHEMDEEQLWGELCLNRGRSRYHNLRRMQCLLITLYQVRCNLFHGSKDPGYSRDLELVQSAAIIMQKYMKALLLI